MVEEFQAFGLSCPSCRKAVEVSRLGPLICSRCETDLANLAAVSRAAEVQLGNSKKALEAGCPVEALRRVRISWSLRRSVAAARLGCLAASATGDREAAFRWLLLEEEQAER